MIDFTLKDIDHEKISEHALKLLDLSGQGHSPEYAKAYATSVHLHGRTDEWAHMYALAHEEYHKELTAHLARNGTHTMLFIERKLSGEDRKKGAQALRAVMCQRFAGDYAAAYADAALLDESHEYCQAYASAMAQGHGQDFAKGAGYQADLNRSQPETAGALAA